MMQKSLALIRPATIRQLHTQKELETMIAATRYGESEIDPFHENVHGNLYKIIHKSNLPEQTQFTLRRLCNTAIYQYKQDVMCEFASNCTHSLSVCSRNCINHCKHAHSRLEGAIRDGDIKQIQLIMKYQWINLKTQNKSGLTIFELAKQSKHPAVATLFDSCDNETN